MSKLECLFGFHTFGPPDKEDAQECVICHMHRKKRQLGGIQDRWYNKEDILIHTKNSDGSEYWFDDSGCLIHTKDVMWQNGIREWQK